MPLCFYLKKKRTACVDTGSLFKIRCLFCFLLTGTVDSAANSVYLDSPYPSVVYPGSVVHNQRFCRLLGEALSCVKHLQFDICIHQ